MLPPNLSQAIFVAKNMPPATTTKGIKFTMAIALADKPVVAAAVATEVTIVGNKARKTINTIVALSMPFI